MMQQACSILVVKWLSEARLFSGDWRGCVVFVVCGIVLSVVCVVMVLFCFTFPGAVV